MRMRPLTLSIPKPLLPLGESTPIEMLLSRSAATGPEEIVIATGYRGALVEAYVKSLNVAAGVRFLREERPLGTAGPIARLGSRPDILMVCNCDVVSDIAFDEVLSRHVAAGADLTVVAVEDRRELPYGRLLTDDGGELLGWAERESLQRLVSAGVYAVSASVASMIRPGERLDMPTLAARVLDKRLRAIVYVHRGAWIDLGGLDDYETAQRLFGASTLAAPQGAGQD